MKNVREKIDKYYEKNTKRRQKDNFGSNRFE
jgi:hypothetical protein